MEVQRDFFLYFNQLELILVYQINQYINVSVQGYLLLLIFWATWLYYPHFSATRACGWHDWYYHQKTFFGQRMISWLTRDHWASFSKALHFQNVWALSMNPIFPGEKKWSIKIEKKLLDPSFIKVWHTSLI